jgi:hypothetical protein
MRILVHKCEQSVSDALLSRILFEGFHIKTSTFFVDPCSVSSRKGNFKFELCPAEIQLQDDDALQSQ